MSIIQELNNLKTTVIKVAIIYGDLYFITNDDHGYLEGFKISQLLGHSSIHGDARGMRAIVIEFPEGFNTYAELQKEPFKFNKWFNEHLKQWL